MQVLRRPAAGECDRGGTGLEHLRGQRLRICTTRGQPGHAEALRVALDDVQGLNANRPGTAQH
jgi:hypothetical protein